VIGNRHHCQPPINRSFDELSEEHAYSWTRFTVSELRLLYVHLRMPEYITMPPRYKTFTGEEALIISLSKCASGEPWTQMGPAKFGGDPREFSLLFRWFINHVFSCFYNRISGRSLEIWKDYIPSFRRAFCNRLNRPPTEDELALDEDLNIEDFLDLDPEFFRIFAVIDATDFRTTRTGSGPMPDGSRRLHAFEIQREFYSRYFRAHGLKYLTVHLPNGITAAVFGSRLSDNDNGVFNMSGLVPYLIEILDPIPGLNLYPSIYGDAIFPLTAVTQGYIRDPDPIERIRNKRMASCRMCIEHNYGALFNLFRIMNREQNHQMFYNGESVYRLGIVCFLLLNCYTCFNGSTTSTLFDDFPAPSIAEYLPVDVDFEPYHPVELAREYNYGI